MKIGKINVKGWCLCRLCFILGWLCIVMSLWRSSQCYSRTMDLCDLHEDCEGGDDEYNDICGERNIIFPGIWKPPQVLLIIFCNFHYHAHVLWRKVCWGDSKLHFNNCPFVSDEIDKIGSQYRCDFSNGTCNWAPSIGKMKWIEAQVRDFSPLQETSSELTTLKPMTAMMFPWTHSLTFS